MTSLLVVAGEASGDRAAAAVVARLPGVETFGLGGPALASRGTILVGDMRASTALGVGEAGMRAWGVLRAWGAVVRAARPSQAARGSPRELHRVQRPPGSAAARRGRPRALVRRAAGLGLAPGPHRVASPLRRPHGRRAPVRGADLALAPASTRTTSGHPALETTPLDRDTARRALGMTP